MEIFNSWKRFTLSQKMLLLGVLFAFLSAWLSVFIILSLIFFMISALKNKQKFVFMKVDFAFALLVLSMFITTAFAVDILISLGSTIVILLYGVVFFVARGQSDESFVRALVEAICIMLILNNLLSISLFLADITISIPAVGLQILPKNEQGMMLSIMQHQTLYGNFVAYNLLFAASYFFLHIKDTKRSEWIIFAFAMVTTIIGIFLAETRGALLIFFGGGIILFFRLPKKGWFIAGALVISLALVPFLPEKWVMTLKDPAAVPSNQTRFAMYYGAWIGFRDNDRQLTGIGYMNFRDYYAYEGVFKTGYERGHRVYEKPNFIHNIYLSFFTEGGILGLVFFLAWFLLVFLALIRASRSEEGEGAFMSLALFSGFMMNSLFDNVIYVVPVALMLFYLLGSGFGKSTKEENLLDWSAHPKRKKRVKIAVFSLVSVVFVMLSIRFISVLSFRQEASEEPVVLEMTFKTSVDKTCFVFYPSLQSTNTQIFTLLKEDGLAEVRFELQDWAEMDYVLLKNLTAEVELKSASLSIDGIKTTVSGELLKEEVTSLDYVTHFDYDEASETLIIPANTGFFIHSLIPYQKLGKF